MTTPPTHRPPPTRDPSVPGISRPSIPFAVGAVSNPPPPSPLRTRERREQSDGPGVAAGLFAAVLVHGLVVLLSMRLGRAEGNVSVQRPHDPREDQVLETHLLQQGGGVFDPRRQVHREVPIRAEREAPQVVAPTADPTRVQLARDAGAQDYMAAITGRTRRGSGNQDLAEMDRIAHMAAMEAAADPSLSGAGDPSGSAHGDTTDPNVATRGAGTKIDRFLRDNIRVSATLTGSEGRTVTFRIRLDATGVVELAEPVAPSGNESLDGDILSQAQRLATTHARVPELTPEELASVAGRNINVRVPIDRIVH
ncbi:MAG: hypothetical protein JWM10_170 [Myxococcaceae bacterium]|nr:hypothetical protein [Myxococcaceae bacterium]